jgi:putative membrane protein
VQGTGLAIFKRIANSPRPQETLPRISDHLANERTYLAWLRTCFSLISLGFATNRFGFFLIELHAKAQSAAENTDISGGTRRFGLGMVIFGTLLTVLATLHYLRVEKDIQLSQTLRRPYLIWMVSVMALIFGASSVILLITG